MTTTRLTIAFFGVPRFERAGTPLTFAQGKGVALLLYLASTRAAQPRERLIDLLWPESLPQAARKNMRNTLWAIGEALGADVIDQDGGMLRLSPDVSVDIHALEAGQNHLGDGDSTVLEQAAAFHQGTLAEGLAVHEAPEFEQWLQQERQRLTGLYLRMLERVITLQQAAGAWLSVAAQAQRALAVDPLRETVHLALIEAHMQLGQRSQAMQQFAALKESLQRELGVAPLPETTARYERLLATSTADVEPRAPVDTAPAHATAFVGRTNELEILDAEHLRAKRGEARVIMITGDLGIGKTQLWRTWAEGRAGDGALLATHALEAIESVPFGPLLTLFRQAGPAQTLLRAPLPLSPVWLAELARLLPELAEVWPSLPPLRLMSPAEERARLFQALTEACRLLATPMLTLIVDDLHWADPSTLDWLAYLVDQLKSTPLLVIGTYRPQDAPEHLLTTVAGWQRQGRLRQLALPNLTTTEAVSLLAALGVPADTAAAARWIQQSGGNPYFLTELQRTQGDVTQQDLSALVRTRIHATVPAAALQVLQAAAILGDAATTETLLATTGRGEEDLLDTLDLLTKERVLAAGQQGYQFVHPLVATVLRADLTPARRAFLHRRAAEALEQMHPTPTAQITGFLVEHFAAANAPGRAAHYAERAAGQAAQVGALVESIAYARDAVAWEPTATRHLALGKALMYSGTAAEAMTHLETALRLFTQSNEPSGAANSALFLATIALSKSELAQAREWLAHPAFAQTELLNPALCAEACLIAATIERQSRDHEKALAYIDRAERLVAENQLNQLAMQVAFERGNLLADRGELSAAVAAFAEARKQAEASQDVLGMALAGNNLAYHTLLTGDAAQARRHIDTAVSLTEQYSLTLLSQYVYSTAGEIALALGDLARAEETLNLAFVAAQSRDNRVQMANVRASQALVAQGRHNLSQARALIEDAQSLFGAATDHFVRSRLIRISASL